MGAVLRAAGEGQLVLHFLRDRIGIPKTSYFLAVSQLLRRRQDLIAVTGATTLLWRPQHSRCLSWGATLTPLGTQQRPELQSDRCCGVKPADLKQIGGHAVKVGASEAPFCSWLLWKRSAHHC